AQVVGPIIRAHALKGDAGDPCQAPASPLPHRKAKMTISSRLPSRAGVGFKPEHFADILAERESPVGFIEIHAENYMGEGGGPHAQLQAVCEPFPLSVHGVGLSIGSPLPLDLEHLARLKRLCD